MSKTKFEAVYTNQKGLVDLLGGAVSHASLEKWRLTGGGPPYVKLDAKVLYHIEDTLKWFEERTRTSTSGGGAR